MKTLPAQISAEHAYLAKLLSLLKDDYAIDATDPTSLSFRYRVGENTFASSLTLNQEEDGRWTINRTVQSGGGRWDPPDVDLVPIFGPQVWDKACQFLVRQIFDDEVTALNDSLADNQLAEDLVDEEDYLPQDLEDALREGDPLAKLFWEKTHGS